MPEGTEKSVAWGTKVAKSFVIFVPLALRPTA